MNPLVATTHLVVGDADVNQLRVCATWMLLRHAGRRCPLLVEPLVLLLRRV
jgi:hypothetical protein